MSRAPRALALIAGLALWCACSPRAERPRRIAVIPKGTTHEFWKSIHAGAETAAHELGVEVIWKGPLREDDRDEQIKVVEDFIVRKVDGIVIAPLDDTALAPVLADAAREGIPVIVIDSEVLWDGRVSYVATDNYKGGVLAARALGERLGGNGRVILMRYLEGSASTAAREAGFLDTLKKEFPRLVILSDNQYAGATNEGAYKTGENLLVSFPDVEGIFCPNESALFGMWRALQDSGRAGKVRLVGFDASDKLVQALRAGEIDALVIQNPFAMGEIGVRRMVDHLEGRKVEPYIDTGVVVISAANMDEPAMARLLSPDLSILNK